MKIQHLVLFGILVLVIFVAVLVMFVYKTFSPDTDFRKTVPVLTETSFVPISTSSVTVLSESDAHDFLDECQIFKMNEILGRQYESGSIIVRFFDAMSYDMAIDIINTIGLESDFSDLVKNNFDRHHWLSVVVPPGEEFKWQCILDASEGIKSTSLNYIFDLRR